MPTRNWTTEQRLAFTTRDRTLLLSAAAGSGKTAVLTERVIRALTEGEHPLELSRLLAVTFTRAAAAELRTRIGTALADAVKENPSDTRLSRQLRLLPTAQITTIDAFCQSVLRRTAVRAGLPAAIRVSDPTEAALLRRGIMDTLLDDGYAGAVPGLSAEAFCALSDNLTTLRHERELADLLLSLEARLSTFPRGAESLSDDAAVYLAEASMPVSETRWGKLLSARVSSLLRHYDEFTRLMNDFHAPDGADRDYAARYDAYFDAYLSAMDCLRGAGQDYSRLSAALTVISFPRLPAKSHAPRTPEIDRAVTLCTAFKDGLETLRSYFFLAEGEWHDLLSTLSGQCNALYLLLSEFCRRYSAEARRRGCYDFSQMTRMTYDLLLSDGMPTPVAKALIDEYDAVYVDEYQDVNPIQHAIFEAVSKPRNRFLVGDIKQSIYRFRHAEPDIFAALRRKFPRLVPEEDAPACTHYMSSNFRSDRPVVDFVNAVFSVLFGSAGQSIGFDPETDQLVCGKNDPAATCSYLPVFAVFDSVAAREAAACKSKNNIVSEDTVADDAANAATAKATVADSADGQTAPDTTSEEKPSEEENREATWVAREIRHLLSVGVKNDGITPLRPTDIAILRRTKGAKLQVFADALQREGVPCNALENPDFFLNPEVLLALSLLNTIDNPRRDIYLTAVLCSPLYRLTADDLALVRQSTPEGIPLYDALCAYCAANPAFARGEFFLSQLASFRAAAEGMPIDRLLRRLFAETPLMAIAGADGAGGENNLKLLYAYARDYEGAAYEGLYGFIHFINRQIESGKTFQPARGGAENNGVSLMSIHASKGLEYPVVFLVGCGDGANTSDLRADFLCDSSLGVSMRLRDGTGLVRVDNPVRSLMSSVMREKAAEEDLRVLYVALTRARERLYVTGTVSGNTSLQKVLEKTSAASLCPDRETVLAQRSYLELMLTALGDAPSVCTLKIDPVTERQTDEATTPVPSDNGSAASQCVDEDTLRETLSARFSYVYPFSSLGKVPKKLSVSRLTPALLDGPEEEVTQLSLPYDDDAAESDSAAPYRRMPAAYAGARPPNPTERGIATHLFMQFCDFDHLVTAGVDAEITRLLSAAFLDRATADLIRKPELEKFRSSPLLAEMRCARKVHREFRFQIKLPAANFTADPALAAAVAGESLFVQGVIDALTENADGTLTLIDYKTDRLTTQELADPAAAAAMLCARHAPQLRYYAAAVKNIFGRAPDRILLYSLHMGGTVTVPPDLTDA